MWRAAVLAIGITAIARAVAAQVAVAPVTADRLELPQLAGHWYEIATSGAWSHRRCVADTQFQWEVTSATTIAAQRTCATRSGPETKRGQLRARDASTPARLSVRFAPAVFSWVRATWHDHWVLAAPPDRQWLLIGDRQRERLSVLSRTVFLHEASLAIAIAHARSQGFDVDRLAPVRHGAAPAAPTVPGRGR